MIKQELNKKLVEWAGLNVKHDFQPVGISGIKVCTRCGTTEPTLSYKCPTPILTRSLDACFKWLVPEVIEKFGLSKIEFCYSTNGSINSIKLRGHFREGTVIQLMDREQEALALCKAIEKLMALNQAREAE